MHTEDPAGPTGRPADAGDPADRLEEQDGIALQAAPLLGLEHLEEARLVEFGDVGIRQPPQILGLLRTFPEPREEFVDRGQNRVRVALLKGRHYIPPGGAVLPLRLEHVTICVEERELVAGSSPYCYFCNVFQLLKGTSHS